MGIGNSKGSSCSKTDWGNNTPSYMIVKGKLAIDF